MIGNLFHGVHSLWEFWREPKTTIGPRTPIFTNINPTAANPLATRRTAPFLDEYINLRETTLTNCLSVKSDNLQVRRALLLTKNFKQILAACSNSFALIHGDPNSSGLPRLFTPRQFG